MTATQRCLLPLLALVAASTAAYKCGPTQTGVVLGLNYNLKSFPNVTSAARCCELCAAVDGCDSWNVHTNSTDKSNYRVCHLHNNASSVGHSADSLSGTVEGSKGCSMITGGFFGSGFNIGGPKSVATPEECCAECRAEPRCVAWAHHASARQCWLHDQLGGYTADSSSVGGVPAGPLPPLPPTPAAPGQYVEGFACRDADAAAKYAFCDPARSIEERLDDLVPRIRDDEAGAQLTARQSPNVSRIGLPSYYWGTNAIHGVQNVQCINATCPTSFPAPNALSAAWNLSHVHEMGRIIGQELRAYFNLKIHNSLDTWSPTININRDPRWGRNVESPGEDPLLNGLYGAAYTRGLQQTEREAEMGELQAVVTLKHFHSYSIENYNGVTRTDVDVNVSAYDLADTYLPPWRTAIVDGGALGVMCSYNSVNGIPTCGNPVLNKTLRETWGFKGYMTSDSDSCACIGPDHHAYEPTSELATRDCLAGGTDIDSGGTYKNNLRNALVNGNLTSRRTTDAALRNTYRMRMRMGLFEPARRNEYRTYGIDHVGSAASHAASLAAARQAMTLLKNDAGTLPFAPGRAVCVLGKSVNDTVAYLTGNYNGPMNKSQVKGIYEEVARLNAGGRTWSPAADLDAGAAAAACAGADAVALVVDNAHDGGGEGHDRYTVALSDDQIALSRAVLALDKPTALVLVNGGAISIDGLKDAAPAVLQAWMPGVEGGTAIAETLFGQNVPGGKLPVTIYPSSYVNRTDFLSMDVAAGAGRTYRYYKGELEPLWHFGFGLSYSTFELAWGAPPPTRALDGVDDSNAYEVAVKNSGAVAADEVVQLYFAPSDAIATRGGAPTPLRQLVAFERVHLQPGETKTVRFAVSARQLALVDREGNLGVHSDGKYKVIASRGHGDELTAPLAITLPGGKSVTLEKFNRWW